MPNYWVQGSFSTGTSIPGIAAWYDASSSQNTIVGSKLSVLKDLSGNGLDFTQTTDANRPLITGTKNGLAIASFDGASTFMTVPSSTARFTFLHNAGYTVFAVVQNRGTSGGSIWSSAGSSSAYIGSQLVLNDGSSQQVAFVAVRGGAGTRTAQIQIANYAPQNTWYTFSMWGNCSANSQERRMYVARNGVDSAAFSAWGTLAPASGNSSFSLTLGRNGDVGNYLLGDIAELIFIQADTVDTPAQRTLIGSYLNAKWAIY